MVMHRTVRRSGRVSAVATWVAIVAGTLVVIRLLHGVGADPAFAIDAADLWGWLGATSPEIALLALGRWTALAGAYWIAGSTIVYTAARLTRLPSLVRAVEWATLPAVRRVAERVVAVSLTVTTLTTGGAGAALASDTATPDVADATRVTHVAANSADRDASGYVPVPAGTAVVVSSGDEDDPYVPTPAGGESVPLPFIGNPPESYDADGPAKISRATEAVTPSTRREADVEYSYTVEEGDNLWTTAEAHLEDVLARRPAEPEIATYWSHLIEVNRPNLRSGDPDLIFPGETVVCPPVSEVGLG